MNSHYGCCHPIQCILPPHVVEAIKLRGDEEQRKMAEALAKQAEATRESRQEATPPDSFLAAPVLAMGVAPAVNREVYDGKRRATLPGTLVRAEGEDPVDDPVVNQVYDLTGDVFNLYFDIYRRNSLDGQGSTIVSTVHHRRRYNNAFWNGTQMAYGDGDGTLFQTFVEASVVGHELSHAVVQYSGGLVYRDQAGALNESFADVFGSLSKQYTLRQTAAEADWLVGQGILGPDINGVALRSMKAPGTAYDDSTLGKDPQPYHMDFYLNTSSDNGGVHINSGIPNHAFYLVSQYLGGYAWEKAGQIWYDTMQVINNPLATFNDWADKTVEMARERFGAGSMETVLTRRAWKLVGVDL
ncbi:MAG: M4 family metallopeptidase [Anaerolineae bacterium]|nr:M4 family metallopeptidase [Anaerolineae bacterium]MCB9109023.1 M4 family metallopeptidase [Anaerolineales bacterium]